MPGFDLPRSAATSCSSWKTRAVTAASWASIRKVRSSAGNDSWPSLMSLSLYATLPGGTNRETAIVGLAFLYRAAQDGAGQIAHDTFLQEPVK
jgi:hypothetical protein